MAPQGDADGQRPDHGEPYDLLSDEQRRRVLSALGGVSTPADIETVARSLVTAQGESDGAADDRIDHLEVALHHRHLPKLADAGLVDYDPDEHRVEKVADEFDWPRLSP